MDQEHEYETETEQPTETHGRARPVVTERETAQPTLYEEFHVFALAGDPHFEGKRADELHKQFMDRLIAATLKAPDADWDAMSERAQEVYNALIAGPWKTRANYPAIEGLDSDPNKAYKPQRVRAEAIRVSIPREERERQRLERLAEKEAKKAEKEQRRREKLLAKGNIIDRTNRPESNHVKMFKLILGNPGIDRTSMERKMEEMGLKATKHTVTSSRGSAFCARKVAKELGLWNEAKEAELSKQFEEEVRRYKAGEIERTVREGSELARQEEQAQAAA